MDTRYYIINNKRSLEQQREVDLMRINIEQGMIIVSAVAANDSVHYVLAGVQENVKPQPSILDEEAANAAMKKAIIEAKNNAGSRDASKSK